MRRRHRIIAAMAALFRRTSAAQPFGRLLEAAKRGDTDACFRVGRAYMTGKGAPHYPADAVKWLRRAAMDDHPEAQYCLSRIYLNGARARGPVRPWLEQAEENSRSRSNVAILYPGGMDVERNYDRAFTWAVEAARDGLARAQAHLGMLYLRGTGCAQDFEQAAVWFRLSAAQNDPGGALGLAILYEHGLGMEPDPVAAATWYRKAADRGNGVAAAALVRLHPRTTLFPDPPETSH